jgi:lincosamide nucleotidyltransferase A/C/D/E
VKDVKRLSLAQTLAVLDAVR